MELGIRASSSNRKKRKAETPGQDTSSTPQDYIKQAVFTTAVQLIVWGFFSICVLCYHVLLKAYMRPVFWALVLSIPLHSWKANMVRTTRETLTHRPTLSSALHRLTKLMFKAILGETIYALAKECVAQYLRLVRWLAGATLLLNQQETTFTTAYLHASPIKEGRSSGSFMFGASRHEETDTSRTETEDEVVRKRKRIERTRTISHLSAWSVMDLAPLKPLRHLVRLCMAYLLYTSISTWDQRTWTIVLLSSATCMGLHLLCQACYHVVLYYLHMFGTLSSTKVALEKEEEEAAVDGKKVEKGRSILLRALDALSASLSYTVKTIVERNLNAIVTVVVLLTVLIVSSSLSLFVGTMIVRESHELVETSVRFMNDTVHEHPQVAIAAQDAYQRFITYMDASSANSSDATASAPSLLGDTWRSSKGRSSLSAWTSRALSTWPTIRKFQMISTQTENSTLVLPFNRTDAPWVDEHAVPTPFPVLKTMFNHFSAYTALLREYKMHSKLIEDAFGEITQIWRSNSTQDLKQIWHRWGQTVTVHSMSILNFLGFFVFDGVTFAWDFLLKLSIFAIVLYELVGNEHSATHYISKMLFLDERQRVRRSIDQMTTGLVMTSFVSAAYQALFTWFTFNLMGAKFVYLSSTMTAILTVVPIVSTYLICLPAAMHLFLIGDRTKGICLFLMHLAGSFISNSQNTPYASTTIIYVCVAQVCALYSIGPEGLFLGPLLIQLIDLGYNVFQDYLRSASQ